MANITMLILALLKFSITESLNVSESWATRQRGVIFVCASVFLQLFVRGRSPRELRATPLFLCSLRVSCCDIFAI